MTDAQQQLLDELKQICSQYQREVPTRRRPWPQSIRERIFQLKDLGLTFHRVAAETGIPVMTLYSWRPGGGTRKRKAGASFLPVPVVAAAAPKLVTVTVPSPRKPGLRPGRSKAGTVTVVLTNGMRLEGLSVESAVAVARRLSP